MMTTKKSLLAMLLLVMATSVQAQGLKDAYKNYFKIGVAVNQRNVVDPVQTDLIKREFNSVTAENDMKPEPTEPKEGVFDWEGADNIANFCRQNGLKMRGHCLMWHSQIGKWMYEDNPTKEVFYERMRKHIHAVVNRYKDVVYCWDVVNEAMTDDANSIDPYRQSPMYKLCGDEFIAKAFQFAREADPKGLLFYNDYNECDPVKSQRIYNMVKAMKQAGVPIDGIGMQGHYNIYGPTEQAVDDAISLYKKVVKHIHVTELDIRVNTEMGGQLRFSREGVNVSDSVKQHLADQYARVFNVFRKHKDVIECVTFWNLSDRDSWLGAANYPLPFDAQYQPKLAYDVIKNMLPAKWELPKAPARRPNRNMQRPPFNPQFAFRPIEGVKDDFKPSTKNQPGQPYPQVNSQGYVRFRIEAPDAKDVTVSLGLGGRGGTKLHKTYDGSWVGTTEGPMDEGFHYYHLTVDGGTLTDIVLHSTYPEHEIEKEKAVVCDEIESYNDSPSELIFDEFENILFAGHPLGHNILGTKEQVMGYSSADARRFTTEHYRPDNMIFFAYGDIDFPRLVRLLEKNYTPSSLSPTPSTIHSVPFTLNPPPTTPIIRRLHTHQTHVIVGHRAYSIHDERRMPLYLLNNMLGGPGMNARLNLSLRERNALVSPW